MKHVVIGNGESRKWFSEKQHTVDAVTWGCNAIWRDVMVDNLVATDYGMQQEIYDNADWRTPQTWFANWSVLPASVADMMFMGYDIPETFIHRSKNKTDYCVVSGKDPVTLKAAIASSIITVNPVTLNEKIEAAIKQFPQLDMKDLRMKLEKDVGVWITYVGENDPINNIDFPVGWSTGNTALHLACQQGATEIYILGFDLSAYSEKLNNIYKGSDNYLPSDANGFNPSNWLNQMQTVFTEYRDVKFYWVDPVERFGQESFFSVGNDGKKNNVSALTKAEFCDKVSIL
jgi:hypothetical protein